MDKKTDQTFKHKLAEKAAFTDFLLSKLLADTPDIQPRIRQAAQYTLSSKGKRIRAAIVLWSSEIVAGRVTNAAEIAAAAIEMVHTYSLIHDDLPAMDDDDLRRGRPTCHVEFDDATAILTGDALLTLAFELLATKVENSSSAVKLIAALAQAAGSSGMIAGQMSDIEAEKTDGDIKTLEYIHINKTAKIFQVAATMGAIAAGAKQAEVQALSQFGLKLGLAFQIADDLLDINATTEQLGKTAGKDEQAGKLTYPALLGVEKSTQLEKRITDEAIDALALFGDRADVLRELTQEMLARKK